VGYREPPPDVHPWYRKVFGWVGVSEVPWAGLGWVLLVAVLYSVLLLVECPEGLFWDWLSTLLATLLSVLAAIFLYRHQINRAEEERMFLMYKALDADLETLLLRIHPFRSSKLKPSGVAYTLQPSRQSSHSGTENRSRPSTRTVGLPGNRSL
jgi:hypothetical protein